MTLDVNATVRFVGAGPRACPSPARATTGGCPYTEGPTFARREFFKRLRFPYRPRATIRFNWKKSSGKGWSYTILETSVSEAKAFS